MNETAELHKIPGPYKIPTEILDLICDSLITPDEVCLALARKGLYAHFKSLLKTKNLTFKELLPRGNCLSLGNRFWLRKFHEESYFRDRLLYRLQDSRWRYCADCSMLHPPSAWICPAQKDSANWVQGKQCAPYAGFIDGCVYSYTNLTTRERLIDVLCKSAETGRTHEDLKYQLKNRYSYFKRRLYHECSQDGPGTTFKA
jgi:hypothetical protein